MAGNMRKLCSPGTSCTKDSEPVQIEVGWPQWAGELVPNLLLSPNPVRTGPHSAKAQWSEAWRLPGELRAPSNP